MPTATWLRTGDRIPSGGLDLTVTYRSGFQTSVAHIPLLNPVLGPVLGGDLFEGSLNFWAASPVRFPSPAILQLAGADWLFVPVVILEKAVGVAARKADSGDIEFIEVFARYRLALRLGLTAESQLVIRLLPGKHLGLSA